MEVRRQKVRVWAAAWLVVLAGTSCTPPVLVTVSGPVKDLGDNGPLAGVEVCWQGQEQCTQTDADGRYSIKDVPENSELMLSLQADAYALGVVPLTVTKGDHEVAPVSLGSTLLMELQSGLIGADSIPGRGQLVFGVSNGIAGDGINVPEITAALEPPSGDGPFYTTPAGLPNTQLTATSVNGSGVMVNLEPGRYTLNLSGLKRGCTMVLGWGEPQAIEFEVLADRVTYIRIECL